MFFIGMEASFDVHLQRRTFVFDYFRRLLATMRCAVGFDSVFFVMLLNWIVAGAFRECLIIVVVFGELRAVRFDSASLFFSTISCNDTMRSWF